MEVWQQQTFEKYEPQITTIKSNGWSVHLFASKTGVRRYCSTKVKSCLSPLGVQGKLLKSTINFFMSISFLGKLVLIT